MSDLVKSSTGHGFSVLNWVLLACVATYITGCGNHLPQVDMNDVEASTTTPLASDTRPVLRVAVGAMISPETTREYYYDLFRIVADRTGHRAVFSQRRTYAEVNQLVEDRQVELAFVCSGPYVDGKNHFGMKLLVVPQAHGKVVYHSYIIAHKNSRYSSLDDLQGKRFAFTDPNSNTGCLVPTYMLAQRGEDPDSFFSDVFFTNSHDNSIQAVSSGLADGAAVDSLVWEFLDTLNAEETSQTRIVEKSPPYGIPPIVVHPDLPEALKEDLRQAFLNLHEDATAMSLLHRIEVDRFVKGEDSSYDTVREMKAFLKSRDSNL